MSYLSNFLNLASGGRDLRPRMAVYYLTSHCNFNCAYCEDFGARRNASLPAQLPLAEAKRLLSRIRSGVDSLWLTGGEPLLVPHLPELLNFARREMKFRSLSLISNGSLLPARPEILPLLDRLVISLDSLDPAACSALNMPPAYAEAMPDMLRHVASQQKKMGFRLILNAVITPASLQDTSLDSLIAFCVENKIHISFSPQSVNNWPRYELITSPAYRGFIQNLMRLKHSGAPILGSDAYLKTLLRLEPYDCYPSLIPRILPGGELDYPCRPLAKAGGEQGGREINLLNFPNWQAAWAAARQRYGLAPSACNSCFQQCYAEPSLMQAQPLAACLENAELATFAPG